MSEGVSTMSDESMKAIIERIKLRRQELGYSFQDLADLTKMSKSTLQRYESGGIKNIPLDKLKILATALQVTPAWIMGWEENPNFVWQPSLSQEDKRDIAKEVESLIAGLNSDSALSFDGDDEIDETTRELLKKSLETTLENARLTAKAKYTPKKHRK